MDIFLQTRGSSRSTGYKFLGAEPSSTWWRRYSELTAFEDPTVLVERDEAGWRVYLGGIASNRVDTSGATNRVTVVMSSTRPETDPADIDQATALRLVTTFLEDAADGGARLSTALDAAFPDERVDELYARGTEPCPEIAEGVLEVDAKLGLRELNEIGQRPVPDGSWIGPLRGPQTRGAFVDRLSDLLGGRHGVAIAVNLVSEPPAFSDLVAGREVAVLVLDPTRSLPDTPSSLSPKKALGPTDRRRPDSYRWNRPRTPGSWVAVAALATLIGLVWWLIAR